MNDTAHKLGRPEWGQEDDDVAAEYAAGLGIQAPSEEAAKQAASLLRADWRAAAQFYWAAAFMALKEGQFSAMRENARIAASADQQAAPDGRLLAAIFGGCEKRPAERSVTLGRRLSTGVVAEARAAVQAEMARHDAAARAAAESQAASARAERRAEDRAADSARATEVAAQLAVGQTYTASLPYKLAKKADGLCRVDGVLVAVPGVSDGQAVRITALRVGRLYGLRYEAEGELA